MSLNRLTFLSLLLVGAGLLGCDTTATVPTSQIVVEAYLRADAPLPFIRLSRTVSVDEAYDPAEDAVQDARVLVDRLTLDSTIAATVDYVEHDSIPGLYVPDNTVFVRPQSTYRLRATVGEETEIRATTTVPGPISIVETENDTAVYRSDRQPSLTIDVERPPAAGQRTQNVFTFTTTSLLDFAGSPDSVLSRQLTPFYADGYTPGKDSLESLRLTSSGLLNEGNFERNDDGTITIDLPWLAVAFFGPNRAAVNVVDENYYDFLRSQNVQQGGFAPGEIPNVIENVEGGAGIFGSYARAGRSIFVCPPGGCDGGDG